MFHSLGKKKNFGCCCADFQPKFEASDRSSIEGRVGFVMFACKFEHSCERVEADNRNSIEADPNVESAAFRSAGLFGLIDYVLKIRSEPHWTA